MSVREICMREICALNRLKTLKLAKRHVILNDSTVTEIFNNCKQLETIDMSYCRSITGECFYSAPSTLKNIIIDECNNVSIYTY